MREFTQYDAGYLMALCESLTELTSTEEIIKAVYKLRHFLAQFRPEEN